MDQRREMTGSDDRDWTLVVPGGLWDQLQAHLFPGDRDEHGAVLLAGVASGRLGPRLLVREVLPAEDGVDYVPGTRGYRMLSPVFIARAIRRAKAGGWVYLAAHCHGGTGHVDFSAVDLQSHERGYPALLQLTGRAVGGLVFADGAAAGDLWVTDGTRAKLGSVRVIGDNLVVIGENGSQPESRATFDRQARLLGAIGQDRLERLRVAVVGLGGAGSMAAEMLARLGVGDLVFIDPDRIDPTNVSRIVGSALADTETSVPRSRFSRWVRRSEHREARLKVDIAADQSRRSGLQPSLETHPCDVAEPEAIRSLTNCDWIVLAADSQTARHVVNAVAHAYLIPVIQVGVKIPVDELTGSVGEIFCVARHITPDTGCLSCNGLIDATELQLEAMGENGARARAYVGADAPAPSVITMNGTAVAMGMNQLLMSTAGLITPTAIRPGVGYQRLLPRSHRFRFDEPRRDPSCIHCGDTDASLLAKGDAAVLPIRQTSRK